MGSCEQRFVELVTAGQPATPGYFGYDAELNRQARELFDHDRPARPLSVAEFLAERASGAVVVDTRDPHKFAAGHVRGSLNVPADGRFAETTGSVAGPGSPIVVIAAPGREEEIVVRHRIPPGVELPVGFKVIASGLQQCMTERDGEDQSANLVRMETLFLSLA